MLRLVMDEAGRLWPDVRQQAPGRGTYLCMDRACLMRMNDKRMRVLAGKFPGVAPDWEGLCLRMSEALRRRVAELARGMRPVASLGRDAVMERMWNNAPLAVLMAEDAGDALRRQLMAAVDKRRAAGLHTRVLRVPGAGWLAELFGRELLAVVAVEESRRVAEMVKNCVWLGRLKELGYI